LANGQANSSARKVFLTAEELEQRIASAGAGVIELAVNEHLTPRAQDVADQRNVSVHRSVTTIDAPNYQPTIHTDQQQALKRLATSTPGGRPVIGPVGLVLDRPDDGVVRLLAALKYDGASFVNYTQTACWLRNTEALAADIAAGQLAAGVIVAAYAANAMVLAGKLRGIRPVQGTRVESVAAAVRHYDSNVLVLEHRFHTFHEMRAMIRTFTAARAVAGANTDVMAAIVRHER
jgi:ribose 5-phosphate isomerase RpiB